MGRSLKCLLTGARHRELGEATWAEFDLKAPAVSLTKRRTKYAITSTLPLRSVALWLKTAQPRYSPRLRAVPRPAVSSSQFHFDQTLRDSFELVWASLSGRDTSGMKLLNFPGYTFFTGIVPWLIGTFARANPIIVVVPLIGALFVRRLWFIWALVSVLFLLGHAPIVIGGGWTWYYGYSSAPAAHILIIVTAICIGLLFTKWRPYGAAIAMITLFAAVYFFNAGPAYNMKNLYYSEFDVYPTERRLYVYHDGDVVRYW
jgi:hypothetical protein